MLFSHIEVNFFFAPAAGWMKVLSITKHFSAPQAKILRFLTSENAISEGESMPNRVPKVKFSPAAPTDLEISISRRSETRGGI